MLLDDIPKPGDPLTRLHFDEILSATSKRQENFDEPAALSLYVVLFNIGDRYSEVECAEGEWKSVKEAVIPTDGPPLCPNGHEIFVTTQVSLGWVGGKIPEG